jgi:hypothetical protein
MAGRVPPAPSQISPNARLPITSVSGSIAVSSRVPVAQVVDLSDRVGPPILSPSNRSYAFAQPSRRSSIPVSRPPLPNLVTETPMRSFNPFAELEHEQTWSQADALLRTSRDRVTTDGDQRSRVSFVPDWNNLHVLSSWPNEQASSTPFPRVRPPYEDYQQPFSSSNPFGRSVSPAVEVNPNPMPKAEIERHKSDERADHTTPHLAALSERKTAIKVNKYDGSSCIETFLLKFDHIARYNYWQNSDKAGHLAAALTGSAGLILWNLPVPTYEELVSRLRQRYGSTEQREKFRHELRVRRRKRDENLQEMAQDIERLAALAYPDDPQTTRDRLGVEAFIEALNDPELICKIRERKPASLQSALSTAMKLEILHRVRDAAVGRSARPVYSDHKDEPSEQSSKRKERRAETQPTEHRQTLERSECAAVGSSKLTEAGTIATGLRKQLDDVSREKSAAEAESRRLRAELEALRAQTSAPAPYLSPQPSYESPVVVVAVAPVPPAVYPSAALGTTAYPAWNPSDFVQPWHRFPSRPPTRVCYECGNTGHFRRECPLRSQGQSQPSPAVMPAPQFATRPSYQARCSIGVEPQASRRAYLTVLVDGKSFDCLLDTGCETSVIPPSMAFGSRLEPVTRKLLAANGSEIPVKGMACLDGKIGPSFVHICAIVSEHVFDPMLGIDWLESNEVVWDFAEGRIHLGGNSYWLKSRPERVLWSRRVMLAEDVTVPPSSEMEVNTYLQCKTIACANNPSDSIWIAETHVAQRGVVSARAVVPDRIVDIPMRVVNVNSQPATLKKGSLVAEFYPAEIIEANSRPDQADNASLSPALEELINNIDPSISESVARGLREILIEYRHVFSTNPSELGRTDLVVHSIDTGDAPPFRQALRRHPIAYQAAIDEQLKELLDQGVIEPCRSPYASNLVLVRKKDNSIRCCVDYRQLNGQTCRDAYLLPRTDSCLEAMSGAKIFSTLDMRSGYHQVCLNSSDADKITFVCHRGQFRFLTMPFGLSNAGATFQRLMDLLMDRLTFEMCLVYLDDIICFSATPEQHLLRLRLILQRISECGMKLKASKCVLLQTSVRFLGHVISSDGIGTDPEKTHLVQQWPVPSNISELRGFLGLAGYYRRHIEGYSRIASVLTELTKKGQRFVWSNGCQRAFEALKLKLSSPPVLAMPNDRDTFFFRHGC